MLSVLFGQPLRYVLVAALLALALCLLPHASRAPEESPAVLSQQATAQPQLENISASADLSARTDSATMLHQTLCYAPCGHSVQRREKLPARLVGLTRAAMEQELPKVLPDAQITGFSASEVDAARSLPLPCPLHWILRAQDDGLLHVLRNTDGESLSDIRPTEIRLEDAPESEQDALRDGVIFDDAIALEGFLESLGS